MRNKKQPGVLIVDNDENHQILLQAWFEMAGYKVSLVKYGSDAVAATKKVNPDLVILDVDLPHMDGFETMEAIKNSKRRLPVIINTGHAYHRADVRSFSADAFIIKSSNVKELVIKAREILGTRQVSMNSTGNIRHRDFEVLH